MEPIGVLGNMDEAKLSKMIEEQAKQIVEVMKMPGWKVIESAMFLGKKNIQTRAITDMNKRANLSEKAIQNIGRLEGYDMCREDIYSLIRRAQFSGEAYKPKTLTEEVTQ